MPPYVIMVLTCVRVFPRRAVLIFKPLKSRDVWQRWHLRKALRNFKVRPPVPVSPSLLGVP